MRLVLLVSAFLFLSLCAFSQQAAFVLNLDHNEISLDQYVQVEFTLQNGQGKVFTPPDFSGWTIINGPSTSSQVSIINGVRNSSISYIYTLAPKSIGDLVIGKALIQVNGITLSTAATKVKVTKSQPNSPLTQGAKALSKKDIFIVAKATPDKAYVGQQILVEYKLFTAVNVDNYNIAHAPEFQGFHVNNTPRGNYDNQEFINGKRFVTKVIHTASIYPIQSGTFELEALHVRANVVTAEGNDPNSFFLLPTTQGVDLVSNAIQVKILSLPQPTPARFSGAVGKYAMATSLDQMNIKVNDAISLTVYIEGDGDLNRVGKPFIQADSTAFQYYEPKVTKEVTDYKQSGFIGMRELIYPLVASKPGQHDITPSFVYFDTDSLRYITTAPKVYHVQVSGTAMAQNNQIINSNSPGKQVLSIIQHPRLGHDRFVGSSLYFICLILPFFAWGALFIHHKLKNKDIQAQHIADLQAQLKAIAIQEINTLNITNPSKAALERITDLLKDAIRKKWNISDLSLSNTQWNDYIDRAPINESLKEKIKRELKDLEIALYGGQLTTEDFSGLKNRALEILNKI